ncbi:hypothetical protein [Frankia sp. R82]|uniref:hypothetical protein n=1 Tax=Frankia sp. R82 TaxID=2950553 RepID=UPI00204483B7|nr:hypothetical protein [Frankia sp. R82]
MPHPLRHESKIHAFGKLDRRRRVPQIVKPSAGQQRPAELRTHPDIDRQGSGERQPRPGAAHPHGGHDRDLSDRLTVDVQRPAADRVPVADPDHDLDGTGRRGHPHRRAQPRAAGNLPHAPGDPLRIEVPPIWAREHQLLELDRLAMLVGKNPVAPVGADLFPFSVLRELVREQ